MKKAALRKCELSEALQTLRLKDTFPLHIWCVLLQGAGFILSLQTSALAEEVLHVLRSFFLHPKRQTTSLAIGKDTVPDLPCCLTLVTLGDCPLPSFSTGLKTGQLITLDYTQEVVLPTTDLFGPQNDFQNVLEGDGATSAVQTPRLKAEGSVPTTPVLFRYRAGDETTVQRKRKMTKDRVCCVNEAYLRAWAHQTEEITKWHRKAPPLPRYLLTSTLAEALEVYRKGMNSAGFFAIPAKMRTEEGDKLLEIENDAPSPLQPYESAPSSPLPQLPESSIQLPSDTQFNFRETLRLNPCLRPASVFLRLLQFVQIGQIELQQTSPFGPLLIQRTC